MKHNTISYIAVFALFFISTNSFAWEKKVSELWVKDDVVRFMLSGCDTHHFKITADDPDMSSAHDLLLSTLLSNKKIKVYDTSQSAFSACPTTNTVAGSIRVQP